MESEKSAPPPAIVSFATADQASRRIAGVAAAARVARQLVEAGEGPIWLIVPEPLTQAAMADLDRLVGSHIVRIADKQVLQEMLDQHEISIEAVAAAPEIRASTILMATGKESDGPVSRLLNRPISRAISAALLRFSGIRPLHATIGTAFIAVSMFAALMLGGAPGLIAGGILFHAASVFDGVDGEIARATFRTSRGGAALDSMVDIATNFAFIAGVTVNLAAAGIPDALIAGGWGLALFLLGLLLLRLVPARREGQFVLDQLKQLHRGRMSRPVAQLVRWATIVSSRDFFALLFALLILAGWPISILYIFAAAATVWIVVVVSVAWTRSSGVERSA